MVDNMPGMGLQIQSTLGADGRLEIALADAPVVQPGEDEVVLRVEAAPINPSDLMTLFASANPAGAEVSDSSGLPKVTLHLDPETAAAKAGRFGQSLTVGLEGAGTVIAAGRNAEHLLGKRIAALSMSAGMFAQYTTVNAMECVPLPDDVSIREGAGTFCNPMTALAIAETVRLEGHSALVQTAAASNLGQMLVKICREDGIPLVNVVRREEQAALLHGLGATHVVNSSAPGFREELRKAIAATGATIAFDAIGGGRMAGELLQAMEDVAAARMPAYSPYGSNDRKQVFIYGHLDTSPIVLDNRGLGMQWSVQLWAMPQTLARVGPERAGEMQMRIVRGLKTTFASHYTREISLAGLLDPQVLRACARLATGEKFLINPALQVRP